MATLEEMVQALKTPQPVATGTTPEQPPVETPAPVPVAATPVAPAPAGPTLSDMILAQPSMDTSKDVEPPMNRNSGIVKDVDEFGRGHSVAIGAAQGVLDTVAGVGTLADMLDRYTPSGLPGGAAKIFLPTIATIGKYSEKLNDKLFGQPENFAESLGRGIGTTGSIMLSGGLAGESRAAIAGLTGVEGSLIESQQQKIDAIEHGATQEQQDAAVLLGLPIGAIDSAAPTWLLGKMNAITGGKLAKSIEEFGQPGNSTDMATWARKFLTGDGAIKGALVEGGQEGLQTVLENAVASDVVGYDPRRPLGENFWLSVASGGLVGSAFGAGVKKLRQIETKDTLTRMTDTYNQNAQDPINNITGDFTPTQDITKFDDVMKYYRDQITEAADGWINDVGQMPEGGPVDPTDGLGVQVDPGFRAHGPDPTTGEFPANTIWPKIRNLQVDPVIEKDLLEAKGEKNDNPDSKYVEGLTLQEALQHQDVVVENSSLYKSEMTALEATIGRVSKKIQAIKDNLALPVTTNNERTEMRARLAELTQMQIESVFSLAEFREKRKIADDVMRAVKKRVEALRTVFAKDLKIVVKENYFPEPRQDSRMGYMTLMRDVPFTPDGVTKGKVGILHLNLDKIATNKYLEKNGVEGARPLTETRKLWEYLHHEFGHIIHHNVLDDVFTEKNEAGTSGNTPDRVKFLNDVVDALTAQHQDFLRQTTQLSTDQVDAGLLEPERAMQTMKGNTHGSSVANIAMSKGDAEWKQYIYGFDEFFATMTGRMAANGTIGIPVLDPIFKKAVDGYKKLFEAMPELAQQQFGGSWENFIKHEVLSYRRDHAIQATERQNAYHALRGLVPGFDPSKYVGMKEWEDKWTYGMSLGLNLWQMVQENPHISQWKQYLDAVINWNSYRRNIAADTVDSITQFKNLGKVEASTLSNILLEEMETNKLLSPIAMALHKPSPQTMEVYKSIRLQLNRILDEMQGVVVAEVTQDLAHDPEALAAKLKEVAREYNNMKKSGYFPAMRYGNHTITVKQGPKDKNAPVRDTMGEVEAAELEGKLVPLKDAQRNLAYVSKKMNQGFRTFIYSETFDTLDEIFDPSALSEQELAMEQVYLSEEKQENFYPPGRVVSFSSYESAAERDKALASLKEQYGADKLYSTGLMREGDYVLQGMPRSLLVSMKNKAKATETMTPELEKIFDDAIDGASAYFSFKKRLLKKKGIAGYSEDILRSYAHYMQSAAGHLARVKYADALRTPIEDMQEGVRLLIESGRPSSARQGMVHWLREHLQYIMNPTNELAALRGVGFVAYLGFGVKSAMLNLTQPIMVALPYFSARYGDKASIAAMTRATWQVKDWITKRKEYVEKTKDARKTGKGLDDRRVRHTELYARGYHEGWIDQSLATELAIASSEDNLKRGWQTYTGAKKFWYNFSRYSAVPFHLAEKFNRYIVATTAYELEYAISKNHEKAIQAAKIANFTANYENARWNRPAFSRGKKSVALLFANYLQNTVYFAMKDKGATRFMLTMLMMAGMMGLPFAEDLEDLVSAAGTYLNRLLGLKNPKVDLEQDLREAFVEIGVNPDLILHGISQNSFGLGQLGELAGIPIPHFDVSGSLGIGNVIPGTELLNASAKAPALGDVAVAATGASGNLVEDFYSSLMSSSPDDWKKMEKFVPMMALRNASKSVRFAVRGGEFTAAGEKVATFDVQDPRDRLELLGQALGFTPTKLSEGWESYMAQKEAVNYYKMESSELQRQFNWSVLQDDREARADVMKEIRRYNSQVPYPEMQMKPADIKSSARSYVMEQMKNGAGVGTPDKYRRLQKSIEETFFLPSPDSAGTADKGQP